MRDLFRVSFFYLKKTPWLSLLSIHILLGFLDFMTWQTLTNGYPIFKLLFLFCLQKYAGRWKSTFQYNCSQGVKNMFIRSSWIRYSVEMPYADQIRYRMMDFSNRMNKAAEAIYMIVNWGIPTGISLFRTTLIMLVIGSGEGGKECIFLMISISVGMYYFRFVNREQKFRKDHKNFRELLLKDRRIISHHQALLPSDGYKLVNLLEMITISNRRIRESWKKWQDLIDETIFLKILNYIVLLISFSKSDLSVSLIIYSLFRRFSRTLSTMMEFSHAIQRSQVDYEEWNILWKNIGIRQQQCHKILPNIINIEKFIFTRNNFQLELERDFEVKKGNAILVRGESGSGKTTFFELLRGRLQGLKFREGNPANFGSEYSAYTAQLREIPIVDVSIQEICNPNSAYHLSILSQCLSICQLMSWMKYRKLYSPINAETSSGEKNRLLLALLVLYPLITEKKPVLILDELENGLDPPLAYKILERILNLAKSQNITVFVSSHLEKIDKFSWNIELNIIEGKIIEKSK